MAFQHTATRRWLHLIAAMSNGDTKFQHTATRRWLLHLSPKRPPRIKRFQHTATRRWLLWFTPTTQASQKVSTHSHPKVAAERLHRLAGKKIGFNTQPPEGGCNNNAKFSGLNSWFQHTATRRWLLKRFRCIAHN